MVNCGRMAGRVPPNFGEYGIQAVVRMKELPENVEIFMLGMIESFFGGI